MKVPYSDSRMAATRPGWVQRRPLICYSCYEKGHTSPDCKLRAADMKIIIVNYEALTDEEKEAVPDAAYKAAKEYLSIRERLKVTAPTDTPTKSSTPRSPPPSILRPSGTVPTPPIASKN